MTALARLLAVLALTLAALGAYAQAMRTEVIDLRYRNAEDVLPVLRPLLVPGGVLNALDNRLIVKTTPDNLADLKRVLDTLDRRPRQLVVSVTEDADQARRENALAFGGSVGTDGVRGEARVIRSDSAAAARLSRSVSVLEGQTAVVSVGQSRPSGTTAVVPGARGPLVIQSGVVRTATSGFEVRPRVQGEYVTLDILVRGASLGRSAGSPSEVSRVQTVVRGRVGEWIEVSGASAEIEDERAGLTARSSGASRDVRSWFVRVDER
jgi:hypothetical protein